MKKGIPHSDTKMNFNSCQRKAAENVRKMILKYGKTKEADGIRSSVSVQVISITTMLVDYPKSSKEEKTQEPAKEQNDNKAPSGLAQVVGKELVYDFTND
jgi:hypothetical protein